MTAIKQRTIDSMTPNAKWKAKDLWNRMYDLCGEGEEFCRVRDSYHAMFRDDSNFVEGTAPYERAE